MLRERAACHPFVTPFNSLASITFRYIQVIAPSISRGASPSRSKRSRNSCAFFDCRDASISANSQTVVVFSEITSALTSCLRISFQSHQASRHEFRQILRGALFEFHTLFFRYRFGQRRGRRQPLFHLLAQPAFHHQGLLR